jgi:hypothetical protein
MARMRWSAAAHVLFLLCLSATAPASSVATQPATNQAPGIEAPTADRPVTAVAWIESSNRPADSEFELHVLIQIAPDHWLYARTEANSPFKRVSLKFKTADGISEAGPLSTPAPDACGHYTGEVELRQRLHLAKDASPGQITCALAFQVCNSELCWPPQTIQMKANFAPSKPH